MAEPVVDTVPVDEFAQTRGADDLFDDEIIPISAEQQVQQVEDVPEAEQKVEADNAQDGTSASRRPRGAYHRGGERGRGRGRGRGGRGGRDGGPKNESGEKIDQGDKKDDGQTAEENKEQLAKDSATPSKPSGRSDTPRVQAVRGDRSGTGGIKKVWTPRHRLAQVTQRAYMTDICQPKLTEEELAERMAAAKLTAAKIAAAHARAEADEASFKEREKLAEERRRQEYLNRKAMDGERERNRLRKLNAQTGREWDADKREEDFTGHRGGGQYRRGMHGGVTGVSRRDNNGADPGEDGSSYRGRGRGRGGRGRGRGGHRGRGDFSNREDGREASETTAETTAPSAPGIGDESEFPALPGSKKEAEATTNNNNASEATANNITNLSAPDAPKVSSPSSPLSPAEGTWAEQMERVPENQ